MFLQVLSLEMTGEILFKFYTTLMIITSNCNVISKNSQEFVPIDQNKQIRKYNLSLEECLCNTK